MPSYPPDEFDASASERGPVGVHRRRKGVVVAILTPIAIFIAAGALAYGVAVYMWTKDGGTGLPPLGDIAAPTITQTLVTGPTEDATSGTPSPSATPSPSPTPTATAEPVHYEANVVVLNAAKVSGLAARNAEKLTAGGFSTVSAGNLSSALPSANTVRYADPTFETTAQQVAALLGIGAVELGVTPEGDVSVILVTDNGA